MSKTFSQLRKEANDAPKYVLRSKQFGFDIYIADREKTDILITDTLGEALQFSVGFDNEEMKLSVWKLSTGFDLEIVYL